MKALTLIIVASLMISCASQHQDQENINEALVYLKSKDGNFDLYSIDVLGQWEKRLTTNQGWDWQPHWVPGFNQLAYYTNDTARNFSLVKMSLGNSEVDTLPYSDLLNLKLSPDGKRIYYMERDGDVQHIKRMSLDGSNDELLTKSDSYNGRFALDPKQEQMAFISDRTGSNQLFLMDLNTKNVRQLTGGHMIAKYASFAPDGQQIAVCLAPPSEDPKWDIFIIDIPSGEQIRLTETPYSEQEIAWSLSGEKIAFHGTTEEDGDHIYTIDIKDGKFTKITSGNYYHGEPAWIPAF